MLFVLGEFANARVVLAGVFDMCGDGWRRRFLIEAGRECS
jgi:hypothetical protein